MTVWRVVGALLLLASLWLSIMWDRAEEEALTNAAEVVNAHDERVRQMDEMAREE